MKILHLLYESEGDYFGIGGVGIRAYEIYSHLKERHNITLLCKRYPGARDAEILGLRHLFAGSETRSLAKALLSYAYHAANYVREHGNEYDIIIEEFSPAIPTFLHCFTRRPLVLQVQGHTGILYFRKYNPAYALALCTLERIRPFFYHNLILINELTIRHFPSHKKNVAIIPNGISPELLELIPEEHDYILYFGRIDIYGKGLDILLSAYAKFYQEFPGVRLVVAGDGRDREAFSREIAALPQEIIDNIECLGWISGNNKKEVLRKALFAVFPSRHEVQSIAALEVMGCGGPVIASDIPEFRYIEQNHAGILFRNGDALSLAQSMSSMMTRPYAERQKMGEQGRMWASHFTWDKAALMFEKKLAEIVEMEQNCQR